MKFTYSFWVKPFVVYDGVSINNQLENIAKRCDLLIAIPDRLINSIERSKIYLKNIQFLVIDEADIMLDMGFEQQVILIIVDYDIQTAGEMQTSMF